MGGGGFIGAGSVDGNERDKLIERSGRNAVFQPPVKRDQLAAVLGRKRDEIGIDNLAVPEDRKR